MGTFPGDHRRNRQVALHVFRGVSERLDQRPALRELRRSARGRQRVQPCRITARLRPISYRQPPVTERQVGPHHARRAVNPLEFAAVEHRIQSGHQPADLHPITDRNRIVPVGFRHHVPLESPGADAIHDQRRHQAGDRTITIGDDAAVIADVSNGHAVQGQQAAGAPVHEHPVEVPLVGQRRQAADADAETDGGTGGHALALGLGHDRGDPVAIILVPYRSHPVIVPGARGRADDAHRRKTGGYLGVLVPIDPIRAVIRGEDVALPLQTNPDVAHDEQRNPAMVVGGPLGAAGRGRPANRPIISAAVVRRGQADIHPSAIGCSGLTPHQTGLRVAIRHVHRGDLHLHVKVAIARLVGEMPGIVTVPEEIASASLHLEVVAVERQRRTGIGWVAAHAQIAVFRGENGSHETTVGGVAQKVCGIIRCQRKAVPDQRRHIQRHTHRSRCRFHAKGQEIRCRNRPFVRPIRSEPPDRHIVIPAALLLQGANVVAFARLQKKRRRFLVRLAGPVAPARRARSIRNLHLVGRTVVGAQIQGAGVIGRYPEGVHPAHRRDDVSVHPLAVIVADASGRFEVISDPVRECRVVGINRGRG